MKKTAVKTASKKNAGNKKNIPAKKTVTPKRPQQKKAVLGKTVEAIIEGEDSDRVPPIIEALPLLTGEKKTATKIKLPIEKKTAAKKQAGNKKDIPKEALTGSPVIPDEIKIALQKISIVIKSKKGNDIINLLSEMSEPEINILHERISTIANLTNAEYKNYPAALQPPYKNFAEKTISFFSKK